MVHNKNVLYKEQGKRLSKIRKELGVTAVKLGKESGVSSKTISRYETGILFPGINYLRFLHKKHNVNLNFIFGREERMFMLGTSGNPPDFGKLQELIDNMLQLMGDSAYTCFSILAYAERFADEW